MGLTGEIKLDVLGFRTSFHLDLIEKVSGGLFSSNRSSYSDDVLFDLTSVTLSCLNSINAIGVIR